MAVIKLTEPYHIRQTRLDVRDALMMTGEMCILLAAYHLTDEPDHPRCKFCYNSAYGQAKEYACPYCYGTTMEGGIKYAKRIWAVFTGDDNDEPFSKHGIQDSDQREIQCEAFPLLTQRDYIVRVSRWSEDFRPLAIAGIWQIGPVKVNGIRTGGRFSEQRFDAVGQKGQVSKMPPNTGIYKYPIIGESFAENGDDLPQPGTVPLQPDTKVVYYSIAPGCGDEPDTPVFNTHGFTFIQSVPSTIWTISNPLGRYPASVTVLIDGKVVETDEEYPDIDTIILRFGTPQAGRAEVV